MNSSFQRAFSSAHEGSVVVQSIEFERGVLRYLLDVIFLLCVVATFAVVE